MKSVETLFHPAMQSSSSSKRSLEIRRLASGKLALNALSDRLF
jgi:hypothetical protein